MTSTPTPPPQPGSGFRVVPLWDLAAGQRQLEADALDNKASDAGCEMRRTLDRIASELKRLEGLVKPSGDTDPEICLDELARGAAAGRPPTPTMIVERLSRMVETIRCLEATAYRSGQFPMAEGLSSLGQRFEETLWMMVVNVRDSILSNPNAGSIPGPPAGPNT
jgi:hypothetical protein